MFNVLTEFPEVTEIAPRSGSEVYRALFFGQGLSSMRMRGRFKSGITP